jgi:hypothetical protein
LHSFFADASLHPSTPRPPLRPTYFPCCRSQGYGRRHVMPTAYFLHVRNFLKKYPLGRVYVATDSAPYAASVERDWRPLLRRPGAVFLPALHSRSGSALGNFELYDRKLVNREVGCRF